MRERKAGTFDLTALFEPNDKVEEYEQMQKKFAEEESIERFRNSGVPEKFYKESFDTFIPESEQEDKVKKLVMNFAKNPRNYVLIMYGECGNGKTHLGTSIIKEYGGIYILASRLCVKFDAATSYKAKMSREEILDYYSECELLVLDECGKYFLNPDVERFVLTNIISERYANDLPTVLITNSNKEQFVEFLGKSTYDRFTEVCISAEFNWKSKRSRLRSVKC